MRVLEQSDVRALNKWEMTAQEKEDVRQVCERAGVVVEAEDVSAEMVVATVAAVGEGQRRPLWIWFTGSRHEGTDNPVT